MSEKKIPLQRLHGALISIMAGSAMGQSMRVKIGEDSKSVISQLLCEDESFDARLSSIIHSSTCLGDHSAARAAPGGGDGNACVILLKVESDVGVH